MGVEFTVQRSDVILMDVDEFRTSCTCSCYWSKLRNMVADTTRVDREGMKQTRRGRVHKVLHCTRSACSAERCAKSTWNRDVNAAHNILLLGISWAC
jgi:hypothetical protein